MTEKAETAEAGEPGASMANIETLAHGLADEQPEVSEHAVAIESQKAEAQRAEWAELRDVDGNPFDPAVHVTNSAGEPSLTKNNKLRKRPGRKGSSANASASKSHIGGVGATAQDSSQVDEVAQRRASGVHAGRMLTSVGVMLGGDEWKPVRDENTGIDEQESINNAMADYFEAKELNDIPPGVALLLVLGAYAGPRFAMPKTQTRLGKLKDKIAAWWFNWKVKRRGGKVRQLKENENDKTK